MTLPAVVVLGMHRSGTSCLAGMLDAGGIASAGNAVRNWDNPRGHHEMLDVVRLDEAVLAHSGGHWLAAPREVRWTEAHAAERDRLLRTPVGGRPALLKDPRMLLALPLWRDSSVPFHVIGIVRHPLAVARSLSTWRGVPLADGIALWTAHNRVLAADRARHGYSIVDFDRPIADVVAAARSACANLADAIDDAAFTAACEARLVHHDATVDHETTIAGLDDALAIHRELVGDTTPAPRPEFPRTELARFGWQLADGAIEDALRAAREAVAAIEDAAAVLLPVVAALVRRGTYAEARALIAEYANVLDDGIADLLLGKILLASGDARAAVPHLEAACAVAQPPFQAHLLRAHALRGAGRRAEARTEMARVADVALYAHGYLATLAEWRWRDGERTLALDEMASAIDAAPLHRRGRLRTRRATWLLERGALGDREAARAELARALEEDPGYGRSREMLATIGA